MTTSDGPTCLTVGGHYHGHSGNGRWKMMVDHRELRWLQWVSAVVGFDAVLGCLGRQSDGGPTPALLAVQAV